MSKKRENFSTIFEKNINAPHTHHRVPKKALSEKKLSEIIPFEFIEPQHGYNSDKVQILPEVPEVEVVRHYISYLSHMNYGVDNGFYPLGSCTMKYNPKINENIASLDGFSNIHPLQPQCQGSLELMYELEKSLCEITGMDEFTLEPAAGAHGEFTGISIIKKFFKSNGKKKKFIVIPDSAHGTNPASASMCGFGTIVIKSNDNGEVSLDELEFAMKQGDIAGFMLTNPNTLGLFERNILKITEIVHKYSGLCYYDGANMNAMMGKCKPGDMGFDIIHLNLHKTFSTPHGGGGPGAGPVGVKSFLRDYLPNPRIVQQDLGYELRNKAKNSIGKVKSFYGNFGVLVKAYTYIIMLGRDGLKRASENAVLNANYLRVKLMNKYDLPIKRICQHEFVISDKNMSNDVSTIDIAKRLLDYGIHAPTIYFPQIVDGAMMIEPTETESKERLDHFIETMLKIREEAEENPELLKKAPINTNVGRLDAVQAARKPVLKYNQN
ncbi:MAG: aminomethyl-transferring glycine dehydrogenase subunit GcvPB [Promethearchaeota archaeon]